MQQVPWLKHHPQLRGCGLRPHLVRDAGGLLSPSTWKGDNKARNIGKAPQDTPTPPSPPNCCPHPHHPLPAPPHALNTFLRCSSCFPPIPGGRFFQHGHSPLLPKKAPGGAQTTGKASSVPGWVAKAPCPVAPMRPGTTHTHPLPQAPRFAGCVPQAGSHLQPSATGFPRKPEPGRRQQKTVHTSDLSWSR